MDRLTNPEGEVTVGVVGKYVGLQDAYKSLNEALVHGGIANRVKVNIRWLDAELFEHDNEEEITAQLEAPETYVDKGKFHHLNRELSTVVDEISAATAAWEAAATKLAEMEQ